MERDNDTHSDLAELGTVTDATQGGEGVISEGRLFWTPTGLSRD